MDLELVFSLSIRNLDSYKGFVKSERQQQQQYQTPELVTKTLLKKYKSMNPKRWKNPTVNAIIRNNGGNGLVISKQGRISKSRQHTCVFCKKVAKMEYFPDNCNRCIYCQDCFQYLCDQSHSFGITCVSKILHYGEKGPGPQCALRKTNKKSQL